MRNNTKGGRDDGQLWRCSLASHSGTRDGDHKVGVAMLCKMTWYYLVDVVKGEGSGHLDLHPSVQSRLILGPVTC